MVRPLLDDAKSNKLCDDVSTPSNRGMVTDGLADGLVDATIGRSTRDALRLVAMTSNPGPIEASLILLTSRLLKRR